MTKTKTESKKSKRASGKRAYTVKNHNDIWRIMQDILAHEKWNTVHSDGAMSEAVRHEGVYCTPMSAYEVRAAHKIANSDARRIDLFAKQHAKQHGGR